MIGYLAACVAFAFSGGAMVLARPELSSVFSLGYGMGAAIFAAWLAFDARRTQRRLSWAAAAAAWPAGVPAYLISGSGARGALWSLALAAALPCWMVTVVMARGTVERRLKTALDQAVSAYQAGDQAALQRLRERAPALARDARASWQGPFLNMVVAGENGPAAAQATGDFVARRRGQRPLPLWQLEDAFLADLAARFERRRALAAALAAVQRGDPSAPEALSALSECDDRLQTAIKDRAALQASTPSRSLAPFKAAQTFLDLLQAQDEKQAPAAGPLMALARFYRNPRLRQAQALALQAGQLAAQDPRAALPLARQAAQQGPELAGNQLVLCMLEYHESAYGEAQAACEAGLRAAPADPTIPEAARPMTLSALHGNRGMALMKRWRAMPKKAQRAAGPALLAEAKADQAAGCSGGPGDSPAACKALAAELALASAAAARRGRRR